MHTDLCCGLYRGKIFMRERGVAGAALLPIGNAEINISQTLTEITQPNFQTLGGNNCAVAYPESVNLNIVAHCLNPENLAKALLGTFASLEGSVTDEEHVVNAIHELVAFDHVPQRSSVVVKGGGVYSASTYVEGTDYILSNGGIEIITGSSIPLGSEILVDYTYGVNYRVDAQTVGQKEYEVVLDGFNAGGDQRPMVLKAFRVKLNPTEEIAIISGEEFASLNLNGEILADPARSSGSQFFTIEWGVAS